MCFSATASFATGAIVAPSGLYGLRLALNYNRKYVLITLFVLVLAAQQIIEGFVWLALHDGNYTQAVGLGKLFLFFSHFFWPVAVPVTACAMEEDKRKRGLFFLASIGAFVFASFFYFPLLIGEGKVSVEISQRSVYYITNILYDAFVPREVPGAVYSSFVAFPLVFSSNENLRHFGWTIVVAFIPAFFIYYYAFTSVWCFFAAIVSLYIVYMVMKATVVGRKHGEAAS
ncbi:MAG: DUF6629 family protein [Thermodesulfobacteriota bacterium]